MHNSDCRVCRTINAIRTAATYQVQLQELARQVLSLPPSSAKAELGMDYETAYALIFRAPLRPRLNSLIAEYGIAPLSWELGVYGWDSPAELLNAL